MWRRSCKRRGLVSKWTLDWTFEKPKSPLPLVYCVGERTHLTCYCWPACSANDCFSLSDKSAAPYLIWLFTSYIFFKLKFFASLVSLCLSNDLITFIFFSSSIILGLVPYFFISEVVLYVLKFLVSLKDCCCCCCFRPPLVRSIFKIFWVWGFTWLLTVWPFA